MGREEIRKDAEKKMQKAMEVLLEELKGLRTGRASPALVEHIKVGYYGAMTPLKQVAVIAAPEPQTLTIKPYDVSLLKEIEKAILQSDLGLNPQSDGKLIRLVLPPLSEERRKKLAQQAKDLAEQAKVSIRNVRRDANKHIDKEEDESLLTEDDAKKARDDVQKLTRDYEKKADESTAKKTEEIMKL
jgi:ribosome recycling factor